MRHFAPTRFNRRSIRLKGYDYTGPGEYFVTINTHHYLDLFGRIVDGEMWLNECGEIARDCWLEIQKRHDWVYLDEFIIMPNHVQGIIIFHEREEALPCPVRATQCVARTGSAVGPASGSIGSLIGQFKSAVSKRINSLCGTPGAPVWHRNYHDRIIRGEREFQNVQRYIIENPRRWDEDRRGHDQEFLPLPTPK